MDQEKKKQRDGYEIIANVGTFTLTNGKKLTLYPLTIRDYAKIRDAALSEYRRDSISVFTENIDLVPGDLRKEFLQDAFAKAQGIHHEALPKHDVKNEHGVVVLKGAEYTLWWMASSPNGLMMAVWLSVRKHPGDEGITLEEVKEYFPLDETGQNAELHEVGQKLGDVTNPGIAGNGEPPASPGDRRAERRARRRRRAKKAKA